MIHPLPWVGLRKILTRTPEEVAGLRRQMVESQFVIRGIFAPERPRHVKEERNEGQGIGKENV